MSKTWFEFKRNAEIEIMKKLNGIWQKNKLIVIGLILWMCIGTSMILAYRYEWSNNIQQPHVVEKEGTQETQKTLELHKNDTIEQVIQVQSNALDGISIRFGGKKDSINRATVELCDEQSGDTIQSWKWDPDQDNYGEYYRFKLNNPISDIGGTKYVIRIHVLSVEDGGLYIPIVDYNESDIDDAVLNCNGAVIAHSMMGYEILDGIHMGLKYFAIAFFAGIVLCFIVLVVLKCRKTNLAKCFVLTALVIGVMYMFVLAPFSVPDEPAHFATAYAQSSMLLGKTAVDADGKVIMDSDLWQQSIDITRDSYVKEIDGMLGRLPAGDTISTRTMLTATLGYIPQVVGISLARILGAKGMQIIMAGRLMALLFYCMCMYWVIKTIPCGKELMVVIGLFPMTFQQVVSYSYDSLLIDACFVMTALLVTKIVSSDKISVKDIIVLAITTVIIATLKFLYLPILGLAFLINPEQFGGKKRKKILGVAMAIIGVASICISKLATIMNSLGTGTSATNGAVEKVSLGYALHNPLMTCEIFWRTIERSSSDYLGQMISTPLGWLNFHIPNIILIAFVILLLCSICNMQNKSVVITRNFRYLGSGMCLLIVLLVMASLFFDWTSVGSMTIQGIQGRYFLPVLPIAGLACSNNMIVSKKNMTSYLLMIAVYLNCWTLYFVTLRAIAK